jgi:heme exporter protein D
MSDKPHDPSTIEGGFHEYLGDGVYASFDGSQIWLAVNDHRNKVVALEPMVMASLVRYSQRLSQAITDQREARMREQAGGDNAERR